MWLFCILTVLTWNTSFSLNGIYSGILYSRLGNFKTPLHKMAKVACTAEHMKKDANYVCTKEGSLVCLYGWKNEDKLCNEPICEPPCNSWYGYCSHPNTCTCEVGWKGSSCNECIPLPGCENGYCHKPYECICLPGWDGAFCDKPICNEGCIHGTCSKPNECICHSGWIGPNCTSCMTLPGCSNYGYCQKPMQCSCHEGWTGNFCTEPLCAEGCNSTTGFCDVPGECWCKIGWKGPNCDECEPYPGCLGTCEKPWECICPPGKYGRLCQHYKIGKNEGTTKRYLTSILNSVVSKEYKPSNIIKRTTGVVRDYYLTQENESRGPESHFIDKDTESLVQESHFLEKATESPIHTNEEFISLDKGTELPELYNDKFYSVNGESKLPVLDVYVLDKTTVTYDQEPSNS